MKKIATLICTSLALSFAFTAKSQSLLSPDELVSIRKLNDSSAIDKRFSTFGYTIGIYGWHYSNKDKVCDWIFQSHPGEYIDFSITRTTDTAGKTKMVYCIGSLFYYKMFMQSLIKEKYTFAGIDIINKQASSVFTKGKDCFLVQQRTNSDKSSYAVIQIE